jgi:hypothetical protein
MRKRSSSGASDSARKPGTVASAPGYERYELVEVERSALKDAPYNPRVIGDAARRKLRAGIKTHGLVGPPTWNRRSGHIVSGHQRLAQLDALMRGRDYRLRVAAIDVEPAREKELVVLLNNPEAQGEWDLPALEALVKDGELEPGSMGFDAADLVRLFGEGVVEDRYEALLELGRKVREMEEAMTRITATRARKDETNFYVVVIARDAAEMTTFLADCGLPDNRYQSVDDLRERLVAPRRTLDSGQPVSDDAMHGRGQDR